MLVRPHTFSESFKPQTDISAAGLKIRGRNVMVAKPTPLRHLDQLCLQLPS